MHPFRPRRGPGHRGVMSEEARPWDPHEVMELSNRPDGRVEWWADLRRSRGVLMILARKDFQTRYKRASFGVAWAVFVPLIQAAVIAVIFAHVVKTGGGRSYSIYVLSGIVPYTYFATVLSTGATAIVDGANISDKVWFPRVILVIVPAISNLAGFLIALALVLALMPALGVGFSLDIFYLLPAVLLLVAFTVAISSVVSALHVYFRDVKFFVQASLMVWMYLTPIVYPLSLLHHLKPVVEINPLTGVVALFRLATLGRPGPLVLPVTVTIAAFLLLAAVGAEVQRRYDRLFVDLL